MSEVAMSYEKVVMLNIGAHNASGGYDASGVNFVLLGEGFTKLDESLNPKTESTTYIHEASESVAVTGYAPKWGFDGEVIKSNSVIAFLRNIGKNHLTGNDAEAEIIIYDVWDVSLVDFTVDAQKYTVAIAMDSNGNIEGGSKLEFSGELIGKGNAVQGTFNTSTKAFVPY